MSAETQQEWSEGLSPAADWDAQANRRVLDELFCHARQYRDSKAYHELLTFVARFRWYAPYNAMLVHVQRPGSTFVAPVGKVATGRRVLPGVGAISEQPFT
jgi:hypothetical protein